MAHLRNWSSVGASLRGVGLSSASLGQQTGLLAGLASLAEDGRQTPLGLDTDFAAVFNLGITSIRDETSLYGYVRQSPVMRADPEGLNPAIAIAGICLRYPAVCASAFASAAELCKPLITEMARHRKGKRRSTEQKHQEGDSRRGRDFGGEKGDDSRRPPRNPPNNWDKGWPPAPGDDSWRGIDES